MTSAVIVVPLFTRIGLGSVLGYLSAGILIGPWGLKFINNAQDVLEFSELGVVLLLFIIGLELEPRKLWGMRKPIIGAGGSQMILTSVLIGGVAVLLGIPWQTATIIGLGFSLSSTAISLQLLTERHLLRKPVGETGFPILLLQDIAVIPILALIPLLSSQVVGLSSEHSSVSGLTIITVFISIFLVGRYALKHIFRFVAASNVPEIFTALSLLLVFGLGMVMHIIGISMALGSFLGGVILANSEYRHALESDIQPFKGLLLGLFFISVGMTIDFALLFHQPILILTAATALVTVKAVVLYLIAWVSKLENSQRLIFSFLFSQSGEFAFVLFAFAATAGAISSEMAAQLTLIVTMSMVTTPLLMIVYDRYIEPVYAPEVEHKADEIDQDSQVILVGFGRVGQVIGRMLHANNITPTIIDNDPDHIERVRRFGFKTYYGDVLNQDVLHSINAATADLIILTGDSRESNNMAVEMIQKNFPRLKIIARAHDRIHAMHLIDRKLSGVTRETFYSSVEMGKQTLKHLGFSDSHINQMAEAYIARDVETLYEQVENRHDEKALLSIARDAREQLEQTLEADQRDSDSNTVP